MDNKRKKKKKRIKIVKATSCWICREKIPVIDYKDLDLLEKFITNHGKIMNRRRVGVCTQHMHEVSNSIKRAQYLAMIPFRVY